MANASQKTELTSVIPGEATNPAPLTLIDALEGKKLGDSNISANQASAKPGNPNEVLHDPNSANLVKNLLHDHRVKREQQSNRLALNNLHEEESSGQALKPNFNCHGQEYLFASKSLFLFKADNRLRQAVVWLITHRYFDPIVTIVIVLNMVILILNEFKERIEQPFTYPKLQSFLDTADQTLLLVYILEFCFKALGMGFCFGNGTYLKNGSNIFDFVLVIYGIIEYFATEFFTKVSWISVIRTIRVFKILRTFKSLKKLKVILNSLLISFQNLTNVLLFLIIFMLAAAGISTYMLRGRLEDRCRLTSSPLALDQPWTIVSNTSSFLCGYKSCPSGTFCRNDMDYGLPENSALLENSAELNYGVTRFDNMLYSFMSVFIIILGQGWTSILYIYWNSAHPLFCATFMILLILIGNMILINLFLGLISYTFDRVINEAKRKNELGSDSRKLNGEELEAELQEQLDQDCSPVAKEGSGIGGTVVGVAGAEGVADGDQHRKRPSGFREGGELAAVHPSAESGVNRSVVQDESGNLSTLNLKGAEPEKQGTGGVGGAESTPRSKRQRKVVVEGVALFEGPSREWEGRPVDELILKERGPLRAALLLLRKGGLQESVTRLYLSKSFSAVRIALIIFNSLILGLVKYPQTRAEDAFLTNSNNLLSFAFLLEVFIVIWGGGLKSFFSDWFNVLDGLITIANVTSTVIGWTISQTIFPSSNYFAAFRIFRIMKLINIAGSWKTFRIQMRTTWMAIKDMRDFLILMLIYLVISSLLSTELFAYRVLFVKSSNAPLRGGFPKSGIASDYYSPRLNFDSFWESFITNFTLVVLDGWYEIMYDVYRTTDSKIYLLYFILLVTIGNLILLNLFLAVLINNFVSSRENYKDDEEKMILTYSLELWITEVLIVKIRSLLNKTNNLLASGFNNPKDKEKSPSILIEEEMLKPYVPDSGSDIYHKNYDYRLFPVTIHVGSELSKMAKSSEGILVRKYTRIVHLVGKTLFCVSPDNTIRKWLFLLLRRPWLVKVNTGIAIVSALCLAFTDPLQSPDSWQNYTVNICRQAFGFYFILKMALEIFTFGLWYNGPDSYLKHGMNILEFCTNILFLLYPLGSNFKYFKQIGIIRLIYIIDVFGSLLKTANTKVVLKSLILSLPSILSLMAIEFVFFYALGIVNVNLFRGQFLSCDLSNVPVSSQALVKTRADCINLGGDWVAPVQHFDNVIYSMGIIFRLVTTDDWTTVMFGMIDSAGINNNPIVGNRSLYAWYAIGLVVICHLLILNIFAGVVMETFLSEKDRIGGYYLLSKTQSEWLDAQTFALKIDVKEKITKPKNTVLYWLYKFFLFSKAGTVWEFFSVIFSVLPFVLIYHRMPESYSAAIQIITFATWLLLIFESLLKLLAFRKEYFRSAETLTDLSIIVLESVSFVVIHRLASF